MQNSSDCLFHFVDSFDKIESILSDKLYGSRCKEILNYRGELTPLYVPMISFCDMQLSKYVDLGTAYGKYGIGLSKKWAIANKLNPVLYIDKSSSLLDNLIKSFKSSLTTVEIARQIFERNQNPQGAEVTKNLTSSTEYLIYSLYHTKHYEDDLLRGDKTINNYRFYDEREWRYVPDFDCAVCQLRITEEEYIQWRGTSNAKPILPEVSLTFSASDIEFILINSEVEMDNTIDFVMNLSDKFYGDFKKEKLITKILSLERLQSHI